MFENNKKWLRKIKVRCFYFSGIRNSKQANQLNEAFSKLIEYDFEDVEIKFDAHKIDIKFDGNYYKDIWNANFPYAWLDQGYINGKRYHNIMPSRKVMTDFKMWLDDYKKYKKQQDEINNMIDHKEWKSINKTYNYLKKNHHYAHHVVGDYIEDIIKLKNDCKQVLSDGEYNELINKHIESLVDICKEAKSECTLLINKEKIKEEKEFETAKGNYKKAIEHSSKLIESKYQDYTELWIKKQ